MPIPKSYSFRELAKLLAPQEIVWKKGKGKGSHGAFVGLDSKGNLQAFSLPRSQSKDVRKHYLKELCRRFDISADDLF
jgi:hypothetical protein